MTMTPNTPLSYAILASMFREWSDEYLSTRFVVAVPFASNRRFAIFHVNSRTLDDLPGFADAAVIVDNYGPFSFVRLDQRLARFPREHAQQTLLALARHTRVIETMDGSCARVDDSEEVA